MSHSDTPVKSKIAPAGAGAPKATPAPAETLAERYTRMAHEYARPRFADTELRIVDVLLSALALLLLSPLILLTALATRLTSRGPIFYRGRRVGRHGDIYTMYKFRTLRHGAEGRIGQYYGEALTAQTATEATRLGNVLRFLHLDEIPQLWNVLRGDMSIVGPRPIRPTFFEELCIEIPQYWQRLVVRPGITGFASAADDARDLLGREARPRPRVHCRPLAAALLPHLLRHRLAHHHSAVPQGRAGASRRLVPRSRAWTDCTRHEPLFIYFGSKPIGG